MTDTNRLVVAWIAGILLVSLSLLGANSAIGQWSDAGTTGQWITTWTQIGYAVAGPVAAGALLLGRSWYRTPLWIWAACITGTAGLAPVVAGVVVFLAYRGRAQQPGATDG